MARKARTSLDLEPKQGIQVIARAANVLRSLEGEKVGLSLGQIAERVGLARSTVQRIVDALSAEHLVIPASPTAGVRLGPALVRLAVSAAVEFDQITRPIINELSQSLGETVDLSVLKGTSAVFTDQIQGVHRLRAVSAIGETFPLHCTANGKAMLSQMPEADLNKYLQRPLAKFTRQTVTDPAELLGQIRASRKSGLAFDNEEHTEGISAAGTAFSDPLGRVLAISVPVPMTRFKKVKAEVTAGLLAARIEVLSLLGQNGT